MQNNNKYIKPEDFSKQIYDYICSLGVANFVFIAEHPDSDSVAQGMAGSRIWQIGALELLKEEAMYGVDDEGEL